MRKEKNKKKKIYLIIFGIFSIGIILFFLSGKGENFFGPDSGVNFSKEDEKITLKYKNCYAVLSSFDKYQKGITSNRFLSEKIYTFEQDKELLEGYGFENVEVPADLTEQNLYSLVKSTQEFFVVRPENVDYRLKTLYVDDKLIWNKDDLKNYPMCFSEEQELKQEEADTYKKENLYEFEGELYNFDAAKIGTIFAGGEIIPARAVDRTWLDQANNYTLLFDRFSQKITKSDVAIAMLENPISGDPTPCRGCMLFVGDEKNAAGFKEVGFDAFGIGNHFGDGGQVAIERTIKVLSDQEIGLSGASTTTMEEAKKPIILNFKDKKVALLSAEDVAAYYWFGTDFGTNYYSTKSTSGGVGGLNMEKVRSDIQSAKEQADIVIVMMSWGTEYTNGSNGHQKELAHAIINAGADMIIGSHPHWVQEIEIFQGKPIIYSLGNFIFDQTGEGPNQDYSRRNGETRQGMTVQFFYYNDKMVSMDFTPHKMCGYDQVGGESKNKTHNLAWKIQSGEMTYAEVDQIPENQGCVWYQPTPVKEESSVYKAIWDRVMQYSNI